MRIDCHFHTSRLSPCSLISPERACELALDRGLDALLITEHNQYWDEQELMNIQATFPGIKLYAGIEIALAEGYHVVAVGPRLVQGFVPILSLGELKALAHDHRDNLFLFVAHAFRYDPVPLPALHRILQYCDGLEMSSINILRGHLEGNNPSLPPDNHPMYLQHLHKYNLIPVFNTDGHDEAAVGCIANELDIPTPPEDEASLAHLLKTRPSVQFSNSRLLSAHPFLTEVSRKLITPPFPVVLQRLILGWF